MEAILDPMTGENPAISGLMMADLLKTIDMEEAEAVGAADAEENKEAFKITSSSQADFFTGKLKSLQEENANVEAVAKEAVERYIQKVEAWKQRIIQPNNNQIEFFKHLLQQYATEKLEGKQSKSLKLINGTLKFRKQAPEVKYEDNTLLTYLQLLGDRRFLKEQAPKIDKVELKKAGDVVDGKFLLNGQEVPGVTLVERGPKFEVA